MSLAVKCLSNIERISHIMLLLIDFSGYNNITPESVDAFTYMQKIGAKDWDRTSDTRIFNPLLYHLSYIGILVPCSGIEPLTSHL